MSIPDYQSLMLPLLEFASDGEEHNIRKAYEQLADRFDLSEEERTKLLPSGKQPVFDNRVGWAKTYLKKAGLLRYPGRGRFEITSRGLEVLEAGPETIDNAFLERWDEFQEFRSRGSDEDTSSLEAKKEGTPIEEIELAYRTIQADLVSDLLEQLKESDPQFFEQVVIDVLLAMGYGGSRAEAGRHLGRSGDGGVDGIINQDKLGLDVIYIQAKRWTTTSVGRPDVQTFAGALDGMGARRGVFITTSEFTREAEAFAEAVKKKIVLIDGETLARYMVDHDVGVILKDTYQIKELDYEYFAA